MQSRRDQVQAHTFVMGRLTSGVLRMEPDGLDQPVSRTTKGLLAGLLVAGLIGVVITFSGSSCPVATPAGRSPDRWCCRRTPALVT